MTNTPHDYDASADTGSSRPDDSEQQRVASQHQSDVDEPVVRLADDVLLGAKSIAGHITALGFPVDETAVYYLHRAKKWPFHKYGSFLIASKRTLTRHAERLLRGSAA
jgi:hypothetical protein